MQGALTERITSWPVELQLQVSSYIQDHGLDPRHFLPVDLVLILLRIGSKDALERVAELTGKAITKCPAAVPPWPPKPVRACERGPRLVRVDPNPCHASAMRSRYAQARVGMSKEQLLRRGITQRDIRYWQKCGHIAFGE